MAEYLSNINDDDRSLYEPVPVENAANAPGIMDLVRQILRYWYLILLVFLLVSGVGIIVLMKTMKPQFVASGYIEIRPAIPLVYSDEQTGEIVINQNLDDQIELITTDRVMHNAVKLLNDRGVAILEEPQNDGPGQAKHWAARWLQQFQQSLEPISMSTPADNLRQLIKMGKISIFAGRRSNLITVSMTGSDSGNTEEVVNAILDAYMTTEGDRLSRATLTKINALEKQKEVIVQKIDQGQMKMKQQMADSGAPQKEIEVLLDKKVRLENEISMLGRDILEIERNMLPLENILVDPNNTPTVIEKRFDYVNNNQRITSLIARIDQLEEKKLQMLRDFQADHPEIDNLNQTISEYEIRLKNLKVELDKEFEQEYLENYIAKRRSDLDFFHKDMEKIRDIKIVKERELMENAAAIEKIKEARVKIQEAENELRMNEDILNTINRRIQMLEVEQNRDPMIKTYPATVLPVQTKKKKMLLAIPVGGLGLGVALAFLLVRLNNKVRLPDDILYAINTPVIGTVANTKRQRGDNGQDVIDYQIIRSNISLFNDGIVPPVFCVMSSQLGEGKSTLSINMASYFARHNKKVLLIDGDFRRPDIARKLEIEGNLQGITELLLERTNLEQVVIKNHVDGLDILLPGNEKVDLAVERLTEKSAQELIRTFRGIYDHIIIDTPPILTVPDALLWGKLAGAAILSSFAGRSTRNDISESVEHLKKAGVKLLGVVLANVPDNFNYYKYRYDYQVDNHKARKKNNDNGHLLIAHERAAGNNVVDAKPDVITGPEK